MRAGTAPILVGLLLALLAFILPIFMIGETALSGNGILQWMTTPTFAFGNAGPMLLVTTPLFLAGVALFILGMIQRNNDTRAFPGAAPKFS